MRFVVAPRLATSASRGGRESHDPLAPGSPFIQLYDADLVHPAAKGSYLGACVVTATIEDADPTTFTADIPGIDAATKIDLQKVARDAVAAEKLRPPP